MIKRLLLLLFFVSLIVACKPVPVLPTKAPVEKVDVMGLAKEINAKQPKINFLRARIRATYDDQKKRQQVILQMRMQDQKSIWMSATMLVPIAKLLLTPNDIQNLLLGNPLLDPAKGRWKQISNPDYYLLTPELGKNSLRPIFFFDPESFLLKEQRVVIPGSAKTLSVKYLDHQRIQGQNIPLTVEISFFDGNQLTKLLLEYTRVDFPGGFTIPFDIPKGYKKIEL